MSYQWLTYSTATGAIGTHEQSSSPMLQTTTVTVGSGTPTTTTMSTMTLAAGTATTYANTAPVTLAGLANEALTGIVLEDASGNKWTVPNVTLDASGTATVTATCEVTANAVALAAATMTVISPAGLASAANEASMATETTVTVAFDPHLIHAGQAIIGPFDGATAIMTTAEQSAYTTPAAYLYQSGAFAANPAWPALQLSSAQQTQSAALQAGCTATFNAGFVSSASGSTLTYGFTPQNQADMTELATMLSLAVATWPVSWQLPDGTIVSLTQAQFTQLLTDAQKFKWAQLNQLRALQSQVQAATTVSAVQAILWTAAAY